MFDACQATVDVEHISAWMADATSLSPAYRRYVLGHRRSICQDAPMTIYLLLNDEGSLLAALTGGVWSLLAACEPQILQISSVFSCRIPSRACLHVQVMTGSRLHAAPCSDAPGRKDQLVLTRLSI